VAVLKVRHCRYPAASHVGLRVIFPIMMLMAQLIIRGQKTCPRQKVHAHFVRKAEKPLHPEKA